MTRERRDAESGFTLIELMWTMLIFGMIVAIGVGPFRNYQRAQGHLNSTRKIVSALRNAQVRAVAEATTYRVTFADDGKSYVVERFYDGVWTQFMKHSHLDISVATKDVEFKEPNGLTSKTAYFYPRGAASKGQLIVIRDGKDKTYNVTVEGLTARVSYS